MCTIYFVDIRTFVGDEIPSPPNDPGVDVDEEMEEAEDEGDRPDPDQVQIHAGVRRRLDTRFRMELGDQLYRLLVDAGVHPTMIREI